MIPGQRKHSGKQYGRKRMMCNVPSVSAKWKGTIQWSKGKELSCHVTEHEFYVKTYHLKFIVITSLPPSKWLTTNCPEKLLYREVKIPLQFSPTPREMSKTLCSHRRIQVKINIRLACQWTVPQKRFLHVERRHEFSIISKAYFHQKINEHYLKYYKYFSIT